MFNGLVVFGLVLSYLSVDPVMGSHFCEDPIDSIAYANDQKSVFIASGGKYWWLGTNRFPPKDADAKPLPPPMTKTTAAVYINSMDGCKSVRSAKSKASKTGVGINDKEVWITELIGGSPKLMPYDANYGKWGDAIVKDADRCMAFAQIDWDKPIDAIFSRKFMEIYLVQGNSYAMVNCSLICDDPNNKGQDFPPRPISDFGIKVLQPIRGMFVMTDQNTRTETLYVFLKNLYYEMKIDSRRSINGKLIATKNGDAKDILKDFLKIDNTTDCAGGQTAPEQNDTNPDMPSDTPEGLPPDDGGSKPEEKPEDNPNDNPNDKPDDNPNPDSGNGGQPGSGNEEMTPSAESEESGNGFYIVIGIVVVVVIVVVIGLFILFAMRSKKPEDTEAPNSTSSAAVGSPSTSKTGSKIGSSIGSKAGGSQMGSSKSATASTSKMGPALSTRSGIGKSALPKSTTSAVKSSKK